MANKGIEIKIEGLSNAFILHQAMCFGAEASMVAAVEPPEEVRDYFSSPENQAKTVNPIDLESLDGCVHYDGRQGIYIDLRKVPKNTIGLKITMF